MKDYVSLRKRKQQRGWLHTLQMDIVNNDVNSMNEIGKLESFFSACASGIVEWPWQRQTAEQIYTIGLRG